MNDFLKLPYDPTVFAKDLRYLKGQQSADVLNFNSKRYSRNKAFIEPIVENTTMDFIRNAANIYRKGVTYPAWGNEDEWIQKRVNSLADMEKFGKLNVKSLLWTFKKDNEWSFKAYHASDFIVIYDKKGDVKFTIIRTGEFLNSNTAGESTIWYHFVMWTDGKVYNCTADSWIKLPAFDGEVSFTEESNTGWVDDPINSTYEFLPHTIFGKDAAIPQLSVLPVVENVISGGVAFGDIAAQRAFLNMIYGVTGMTPAKWSELMTKIGMFEYPNIPTSEDGTNQETINSLNLGDGKVQLQWDEFVGKSLKRIAHSMGADVTGLFGEIKIESGAARRLQMENIVGVRDENIVKMREFEEENQKLLIKLGVASVRSEVIYNDLDMGTTELDKELVEEKRQLNITNRFKNRTITRLQMIQEVEGLNEEEAKVRESDINNERVGGEDGEGEEREGVEEEEGGSEEAT